MSIAGNDNPVECVNINEGMLIEIDFLITSIYTKIQQRLFSNRCCSIILITLYSAFVFFFR